MVYVKGEIIILILFGEVNLPRHLINIVKFEIGEKQNMQVLGIPLDAIFIRI